MTRLELMELAEDCSDVLTAMEDELLLNISNYLAQGKEDIPAAKWKMQLLAALGKLDEKNLRTIAEYAGIAPDMAEIAVTRAALLAVKEMDEGFSALVKDGIINGTEVPMEESALQAAAMYSRQAENRLNKVNTVMRYFAKSQAMAAVNRVTEIIEKQQHLDILNKSAGKVIMGAESRQAAVRQCIKEMVQRGIPAFVDAAGRQWSPEAYVNMDIRTTCGNAAHAAQFARMDDYGADLIEVSSHVGARPKCAKDQGRIFDRKGKSKKYPSWKTSSFGEPDGILGINCGHHIYPYFEGLSVQKYFPYDKQKNGALYRKKQGQRKLERDIRSTKRELMMFDKVGDKEAFEQASVKLRKQRKAMSEYCRKNNLHVKNDRTQVVGYDRSVSSKAVWAEKKANIHLLGSGSAGGGLTNADSNAKITTGRGAKASGSPHAEKYYSHKLGNVDVNDKNAVTSYMQKFESKFSGKDKEYCLVIDKKGDAYVAKGREAEVDTDRIFGSKMRGSYNTHTHSPDQTEYSFSTRDISGAIYDGTSVMRASDTRYCYQIDFKGKSFTEDEVLEAIGKAEHLKNDSFDEKGYTAVDFAENIQHSVVEDICELLGVEYTRWKRN